MSTPVHDQGGPTDGSGQLPLASTGAATDAVEAAPAGLDADQVPPEQRADPAPDGDGDGRASALLREVASSSLLLTVLAVVASLVVGGVLIAATSPTVRAAATYFFARPADTLSALGSVVGGAYAALVQGGVVDWTATSASGAIHPLLTSLGFATPLIAAGLGIAVGFRAGLFNIGGQGQILVGGAVAGWIGFAVHLPAGVHVGVAVLGGLLGGALWAGLVGVLKARTGAHEVITTIMLNYIAYYLVDQLLHTSVLQAPGSNNPQSPAERATAVLPALGPDPGISLGFVLAIAATVATWWLLGRSSLGFAFRAVGENPHAARTAGIDVRRTTVTVLVVSGLLVGLAGAYQVLGQTTTGFSNDFDAGIGFNAITVALLGRSRPWGVFAAGLLFGVFEAGGYTMQAAQGIDIDIVQVLQSVIVLFIAAPPLVRTIFHLPPPGGRPSRARRGAPAAVSPAVSS